MTTRPAAWPLALALVAGLVVLAVLRRGRGGLLGPTDWAREVLLSLVAAAGHLLLFVVAARAAGSSAALVELVPLLVLALLSTALPIGFGGWGPREAVAAGAFAVAGLDAVQGLAAGVVFGVLSLVGCLPGLLVLSARDRAVTGLRPSARY